MNQHTNTSLAARKDRLKEVLTKKRLYPLALIATLFVNLGLALIGGWVGAAFYHRNNNGGFSSGGSANTEQAVQMAENESQLISSIAKSVGPSVVSVIVTSEGQLDDGFFKQTVQRQSAGTGFFISEDGYLITNRHVVPEGTTEVSITLSDGTVLDKVSVAGRTNEGDSLDIAFLKVTDTKGRKFTPVKIGDSSNMQVGSMAVAIGNALGEFQNTVTSGIISGFGRSVQAGSETGELENLQNLFQTDAAINEGNSGGPLVNSKGEVIGINTAVAGEGAENIGFAIPVNDVKGMIKGMLEQGKLLRPYLGVRYVAINEDIARQQNLSVSEGAYLIANQSSPSIVPGSPAEKAGLKQGDIIIKVNDQKIDTKNSLTSALGRLSVGDRVSLTIIRGAKEQVLQATLDAAP